MDNTQETIAEYKKQGFVIDDNNRVLCATSRLYARYSAVGKQFMQERDSQGKLVKYAWTLVTKSEAVKLQQLICPEDNKPAIKFAYIPSSKIPHFNQSLPTIENEVEEVVSGADMFSKPAAAPVVNNAPVDPDLPVVDETLDPAAVITPDVDPDDDLDAGFDALENASLTQAPTTDGGLTARDVEEKELLEKDISEIRQMCDDLAIEYKPNNTKKVLVKKILG